jgi:type IV secretory pathway VirB6-like protein
LAFIVMTVASIVFTYYTSIGMIQSAIGIVLGPIGVALGFSSYTRGYFQKWLDWMISSGMYVVVVAVLMKLVGQSISTSVATASNVGAESTMNAAFVFDLSIFVLLLSFEIPKLASIFGGGASASGGGGLRMATKAAKGVAGLF